MIAVSFKRLIISLILILVSTLLLVAASLNLFSTLPLGESLEKQDILFWGIITFLFQCSVGFSILIGHRNIISDLNKLISNKDLNHPHSRKILGQLGALGQVINRMMKELNDLLVLRTDRISALNKVVRMLSEDSSDTILVSDTMGTILGASDILMEKLKMKLSDFTKIYEIFPTIKLAEVLVALEKNRESWKDSTESGILCTPVFDKRGNLNLCLWEIESSGILQKLNRQKMSRQKINSTRKNSLDAFKDMFRKKKSSTMNLPVKSVLKNQELADSVTEQTDPDQSPAQPKPADSDG